MDNFIILEGEDQYAEKTHYVHQEVKFSLNTNHFIVKVNYIYVQLYSLSNRFIPEKLMRSYIQQTWVLLSTRHFLYKSDLILSLPETSLLKYYLIVYKIIKQEF